MTGFANRLAEEKQDAPRVRFRELAAELKTIAFALAVSHADLDGTEVFGVILSTDGKQPADLHAVRN